MFKIISPTGVSITKSLTEEEVNKLKADGYFKIEPETNSLDDFFADAKPAIRIHKVLEECQSCSA